MSNSKVSTSVSGNNVTITVNIDASDILFGWWLRIVSKYDYGYGKGQGVGDYPWIVEIIDHTSTFDTYYHETKTYKPGLYAAELNLMHVGAVDYSVFELGTTSVLALITIPSNATVEIGKTTTLTVACKDKNGNVMTCPTLKWGSGTSNVTVNNGVVTAISLGTALVNCWDIATGLTSNICSITIKTPTCRNPKYKCSGITCISDNCDGTGTFTTPDCNNTCTCPDQGSKCDLGGNQCYYNVKTCLFDCQPCSTGTTCQMQGGLAKCVSGSGTGVLGSITVDKTASIQIGKTITLTAVCKDTNGSIMVCPNLIWASSVESVATVSAGVVTGVSAGTSNIIAKDSATNKIVSNAGVATVVTVETSVETGNSLTDWLQKDTCLDTQKKYCEKNWIWGTAGVVALILFTRK